MKKPTVLVTGGGAPGGLGIVTELLSAGYTVFVCDANQLFIEVFRKSDLFAKCLGASLLSYANKPENYVADILNLTRTYCFDFILPLVTRELFLLASISEELQTFNCKAIVQDHAATSTLNDKWNLYQFCLSNNINVPLSKLCSTVDEVRLAIERNQQRGILSVAKPRNSNGSRGVRILNNQFSRFDQLMNQKPGSLDILVDDYLGIISGHDLEVVISEFLPGKEVTVDCIAQDHKLVICLIRERLSIRSGITVAGKYLWIEEVYNYCKTLAHNLHLDGPFGLQFKQDAAGSYKLIESNPRLQGTSCAAKTLGINYPDLAIRLASGLDCEVINSFMYPETSFWRYYQEI